MIDSENDRKKTISVITLHTSINYGSALQTYATRRVFEQLGYNVEFVDYVRNINTDESLAKRMLDKTPYKKANRFSLGLFYKLAFPFALNKVRRRARPIREFIKKYVPLTNREYHSIQELRDDPPNADIYCTGSDQVWNSVWNEGVELPYFLDYAPEGKKRIAFAASIGRTEIGDDECQILRELLVKYSDISMRESSGVDLLASIGISSTWVLDPTLMLTREEWNNISIPRQYNCKNYLLLYVLNWNDGIEKFAFNIAKKYNLEILRICKTHIKSNGIKPIVVSHVEELISYFREATCILTDSFHATAFSINLHTKFVAVPPPRFKTRIESLLSLVDAKQCYTECFDIDCYQSTVDWDNVDNIIEEERRKTTIFLNRALDIEE